MAFDRPQGAQFEISVDGKPRSYRSPAAGQHKAGGNDVDLAEFIDVSLTEILSGIRAAQKREGGDAVGAVTAVDFDVSVVAETKDGGRANLKVWDIGVDGEAGRANQHTSRLKFSVPLRMSTGSTAPTSGFNIPDDAPIA